MKIIKLSSPVMDMSTKAIWKTFELLDESSYSELYDKYNLAGVPLKNQRTASLLNNCSALGIKTLQSLEPELYDKINSRFNNIDFLKDYGKYCLYNISKPNFKKWEGEKCDLYNEIIRIFKEKLPNVKIEIGDKINFECSGRKIRYPIDYLMDKCNLDNDEKNICNRVNKIPITWRDYCIHLINHLDKNVASIYKNKIIGFILGWKYVEYVVSEKTLLALQALIDVDNDISDKVIGEHWDNDDIYVQMTNKPNLSLSKCPNESLEKEAADIMEYLHNNNLMDKYLNKSIAISSIFNKYFKNGILDIKAMRRGDLKEDVHSTINWKLFCICIMKNDIHMTYANGNITFETEKVKAEARKYFN